MIFEQWLLKWGETVCFILIVIGVILYALIFVAIPYQKLPANEPFDACTNWDSAYVGHPNTYNPTIQECVNETHPAYLTSCCDYKYGNDLYYQKMRWNP